MTAARKFTTRTVRTHDQDCKLMQPVIRTKWEIEHYQVAHGNTECTCGGGTLIKVRSYKFSPMTQTQNGGNNDND